MPKPHSNTGPRIEIIYQKLLYSIGPLSPIDPDPYHRVTNIYVHNKRVVYNISCNTPLFIKNYAPVNWRASPSIVYRLPSYPNLSAVKSWCHYHHSGMTRRECTEASNIQELAGTNILWTHHNQYLLQDFAHLVLHPQLKVMLKTMKTLCFMKKMNILYTYS